MATTPEDEQPARQPWGSEQRELDAGELTRVLGEFTRASIRLPGTERHSFTTLSVLHTLTHRGPLRLSALTENEQITQPAVTQLVGRLEREGLVERRSDPGDGRAVLVAVTPAGARITRARHRDRVRRLARLTAEGLSAEERRAIDAALPALAHLATLMTAEREERRRRGDR
ncbi:MarR family winged helix-turn-helix transcriptional regulator [Streptomyces triticirhizae]|uniref:MarR family transcriptional regulator n=1 Tax=Streptomyces triticirhizae TaxID=2483353 RepID=A0A3M2L6C2_9ACTN|nr:MarR family transcriptional regulator [Streptomyces triticirhizae]RMI33199.1 MarR family transcriptional regulator [Streptomyces triticirhizae]